MLGSSLTSKDYWHENCALLCLFPIFWVVDFIIIAQSLLKTTTNNYSTFLQPIQNSRQTRVCVVKKLMSTSPKAVAVFTYHKQAQCSGWRPYNDHVTESCPIGSSTCVLLLETKGDMLSFRLVECWMDSAFVVWYHKTATTGFGDVMSLLFHIWSCTVLHCTVELKSYVIIYCILGGLRLHSVLLGRWLPNIAIKTRQFSVSTPSRPHCPMHPWTQWNCSNSPQDL